MIQWLAGAVALLGLLPFVVFPLVYIIVLRRRHERSIALKVAADVTTCFLFPVVIVWGNMRMGWHISAWLLLAVYVVAGIGLAWLQWNKRRRLHVRKIGALLWRATFLFSMALYVLWVMMMVWTGKWA